MKTFKYFSLVILLILVGFFAYIKLTKPETIMILGTEVSLEKQWIEFDDGDNSNIGSLIKAYHFEEGKKNFKKKISENELIIACLKEDGNWKYYYYYRGQESYEMMLISEEMAKEITSPY
jgi:hypothetical protein